MKKYNVAVVGVGAVGIKLLSILRQRSFPINELKVFARSERDIEVNGVTYHVNAIEESSFENIDIALFAGTEGAKGASVRFAHKFIEAGATVIDNGGDFRLKPEVPLIVPEANRDKIYPNKGLIANPNCTTIQAVVALAGIYKKYGLERIIMTSFQATSGGGRRAAAGLWQETKDIVGNNSDKEFDAIDKKLDKPSDAFSNQIAFNALPQIGSFKEDDYTSEEWKVVHETHKILSNDDIKITSTCVRIPVFTSHSEAIYFQTSEDADLAGITEVLTKSEGVKFFKTPAYPLAVDVEDKDGVYVGRLRRDPYCKNCFWLWCVADNLRKGAALNAVQIAEELAKQQT